VLTPVGIGDNA